MHSWSNYGLRGFGIALLGLMSCNLTEPCGCTPARHVVELLSGDAQSGAAGEPLAEPIVVRVDLDRGEIDRGVRGIWVHFQPAGGSGTVEPDSALSDAEGQAATTWTLGPDGGPDTLYVSPYRGGHDTLAVAEVAEL